MSWARRADGGPRSGLSPTVRFGQTGFTKSGWSATTGCSPSRLAPTRRHWQRFTRNAIGRIRRSGNSGRENGSARFSLAAHYSPTVEWYGPAGRQLFGAGAVVGFCASLLAAIPDAVVSVDHVAAVPFLDLGTDVAVRWSLAGTHTGPGLHGAASGNPVDLLAVTHWRICDGKIVAEWTVYDEIALLRQLLQGRP